MELLERPAHDPRRSPCRCGPPRKAPGGVGPPTSQHYYNVAEAVAKVEFCDDRIGPFNLADISPSGLRARIEASKVPMMVWCGWLDGGGGEDALTRYKNFSNPQVVVIGPLSHGGDSTLIHSRRITRPRCHQPKSNSRWRPISLIGAAGRHAASP